MSSEREKKKGGHEKVIRRTTTKCKLAFLRTCFGDWKRQEGRSKVKSKRAKIAEMERE